jgi:probable HAF family extracellular repeat protein
VVGSSYTTGNSLACAFLYSDGIMQNLGTLGGSSSISYSINDEEQVVGSSWLAGNSAAHAFLYSDGLMHDLGTLGGTSSEAAAINIVGQIVGMSGIAGDMEGHAFLYADGVMTDLNSLLISGSGWTLAYATSINDAVQIVAFGCNASGDEHALLLTPIPEPATLLLLGLGGILLRKR